MFSDNSCPRAIEFKCFLQSCQLRMLSRSSARSTQHSERHSAASMLPRVVAFLMPATLCGAACVCSGGRGANDARGRTNYGSHCAHWDAPDEAPWCVVASADACGVDGTFESAAGHYWAHKPCHGKGAPFVPAVVAEHSADETQPKAETVGVEPHGARFLAGLRSKCELQTIADTGGACVSRRRGFVKR